MKNKLYTILVADFVSAHCCFISLETQRNRRELFIILTL